ncbi:LysR family transcriptional regulator [Fusibacter bizertensis]|uniref:LysR family transcriptional regulator n=1 Tax=Fusibacter bizertensis TaxID=1488331 RepID=A0ABT6NEY0_9FIRM|nr:LysR family transcriptional regulator [Fusibacter bizertensis]MDH8678976.1 LysR family transcriptional regulator [Fusibacter bizertensis]
MGYVPNHAVNFELYKIFYYAANSLNFSKAAATLHVTQSAVSQAIKSLESQLGIALFYRQGRNVTLTYEGEVLFQHVEKAYHFFRSAENAIHNIKSLDEGTIFIGASDTITRLFLIDSIKSFHQHYPKVRISINNRPSTRSIEKLEKGELDIAIINVMPNFDYEDLQLYPLTTLEHIFVSSVPVDPSLNHLSNWMDQPLVSLEKKSTTRKILETFYERYELEMKPAFEFGSFDVVLEAIHAGMGIGFVPKRIAADLINRKELFEIQIVEQIPSIDIGILINKGKPLSIATQKYLEILKNNET